MKSCVFLSALFLCLYNAQAAENLRYFVSIDSPSTKLTMLEMDSGGKEAALMKLDGIKHNDAGKVFMFHKQNDRFMPINGATNMVLIDYNKKTLIAGTVKKVWTLAGLDKDITLEELTAPADVKADALKADYDKTEGAGSYGTDSAKISKAAESVVNQQCGTKISVKTDSASFTKTGLASYKSMAAINGLAELCSDNEYKAAIKEFKSVSVNSTASNEISYEKNGTTLVLGLPKDIQNTARAVKKLLEKKL